MIDLSLEKILKLKWKGAFQNPFSVTLKANPKVPNDENHFGSIIYSYCKRNWSNLISLHNWTMSEAASDQFNCDETRSDEGFKKSRN